MAVNVPMENEMHQGSPEQPLTAMEPMYQSSEINQQFLVFKGPVEVSQGILKFNADVEVVWNWFPLPEMTFQMPVDSAANFTLTDCKVLFTLQKVQVDARIISVDTNVVADAATRRIKVFFDRPVFFGDSAILSRVQFQVVNFWNYQGLWIGPGAGTHGRNVRPGRIELVGGGWKITMDSIDKIVDTIQSLNAESGFALTHTGLIEREDGSNFTRDDLILIEDALFDFLSFASGAWSASVLPTETNAAGTFNFQAWHVPKLSMWKYRESWFSIQHPNELVNLFPGYLARWSNPLWKDAVQFAIHALVESNAESGSVESSLILGQIALELLSAAILVEDLKRVPAKEFDDKSKWPAFKKFQTLLTECGISLAIPRSLKHLTAVAGNNNWADGPTALTQTRNKLAHASLPNLKKLYAIDVSVKSDMRLLVLWYVELVLLRWFDYKGGYRSRVEPPANQTEENLVPWVPSSKS